MADLWTSLVTGVAGGFAGLLLLASYKGLLGGSLPLQGSRSSRNGALAVLAARHVFSILAAAALTLGFSLLYLRIAETERGSIESRIFLLGLAIALAALAAPRRKRGDPASTGS